MKFSSTPNTCVQGSLNSLFQNYNLLFLFTPNFPKTVQPTSRIINIVKKRCQLQFHSFRIIPKDAFSQIFMSSLQLYLSAESLQNICWRFSQTCVSDYGWGNDHNYEVQINVKCQKLNLNILTHASRESSVPVSYHHPLDRGNCTSPLGSTFLKIFPPAERKGVENCENSQENVHKEVWLFSKTFDWRSATFPVLGRNKEAPASILRLVTSESKTS